MASKVTTLVRAAGIEDPGRVADDATQRPDPKVSERARLWQERKPGQGGSTRGVGMLEIVTLLVATGERIGEVLALRRSDIENIDDRSQPCAVIIAGTVDDAGVRQPLPKSEHGYRRLLLPEYGRKALLSQRERGLPFDLIFHRRYIDRAIQAPDTRAALEAF